MKTLTFTEFRKNASNTLVKFGEAVLLLVTGAKDHNFACFVKTTVFMKTANLT